MSAALVVAAVGGAELSPAVSSTFPPGSVLIVSAACGEDMGLAVGAQLFATGSYTSALESTVVPAISTPPATSTLPDGRAIAAVTARAVPIGAAAVNELVAGL